MAKKESSPGGRGPYRADPEGPGKLGTGDIKLRQWRLYRGMTIALLADMAGVSTGTISGIEAGEVGWSWEMLGKLAGALRVTTGQLLGINPLADREFWSLWDQASPQQRQRITDHAMGVVQPKKL